MAGLVLSTLTLGVMVASIAAQTVSTTLLPQSIARADLVNHTRGLIRDGRGSGLRIRRLPGTSVEDTAPRVRAHYNNQHGRDRRTVSPCSTCDPATQLCLDIAFVFINVTAAEQFVFEDSKCIWESVIPALSPSIPGFAPGTFTLTIEVTMSTIDGPGLILGSAGPKSVVRFGATPSGVGPHTFLPDAGVMLFDVEDTPRLVADQELGDVILHEMGHVIGFGTLWTLDEQTDPFYSTATRLVNSDQTFYTGALGAAMYCREVTGTDAADCGAVERIPLEDTGGPGTAGGHWDETFAGAVPTIGTNQISFTNVLMTGFLNGPTLMTAFTCMALQDLGYDCSACLDNSDCSGGDGCLTHPGSDQNPGATTSFPKLCQATTSPTTPSPTTPTSNEFASSSGGFDATTFSIVMTVVVIAVAVGVVTGVSLRRSSNQQRATALVPDETLAQLPAIEGVKPWSNAEAISYHARRSSFL
eukprot:m.278666 g.278666  ORF g.278666 m.278666 type:complete len:472 (-) comp26954_c0_seq3:74-1489(-)